MRYSFTKTVEIDCTLDASEAVMFAQGGKHRIKLDEDFMYVLDQANVVYVSVQIDPTEMARYKFVTQPKV